MILSAYFYVYFNFFSYFVLYTESGSSDFLAATLIFIMIIKMFERKNDPGNAVAWKKGYSFNAFSWSQLRVIIFIIGICLRFSSQIF